MKVEQWAIARVKPYEANPRKNEAAVEKVARSIKEFGFRQPIVVDGEGVILAGHTRLLAARMLKMAEVPVHVAEGLSPDRARAYRLMDNRAHESALWDEELLAQEMTQLLADGTAGESTGFDADEVARLLGQIEPAQIADPPASVTETADRIGEIRAQRKKGNEGVIDKADTEHYLVVVFANRKAREAAVTRLGLPTDERYIDASTVEIRQRVGGQREIKLRSERDLSAAQRNKAGAHG